MATRLRILIVDDELNPSSSEVVLANYMSFYQTRLTKDGHELTVATDCPSGIQRLKDAVIPFDCVIVDISMEGRIKGSSADRIGGIELVEWIQDYKPMTRVIVLTGVTHLETLERLRSLNCVRSELSKHLCAPSKLALVVRRVAASPN